MFTPYRPFLLKSFSIFVLLAFLLTFAPGFAQAESARKVYAVVEKGSASFVGAKDPQEPIKGTNAVGIPDHERVTLSREPGQYRNIGGTLWYLCLWAGGQAWISEEHLILVEKLP